jgi:hypothetical protein
VLLTFPSNSLRSISPLTIREPPERLILPPAGYAVRYGRFSTHIGPADLQAVANVVILHFTAKAAIILGVACLIRAGDGPRRSPCTWSRRFRRWLVILLAPRESHIIQRFSSLVAVLLPWLRAN